MLSYTNGNLNSKHEQFELYCLLFLSNFLFIPIETEFTVFVYTGTSKCCILWSCMNTEKAGNRVILKKLDSSMIFFAAMAINVPMHSRATDLMDLKQLIVVYVNSSTHTYSINQSISSNDESVPLHLLCSVFYSPVESKDVQQLQSGRKLRPLEQSDFPFLVNRYVKKL